MDEREHGEAGRRSSWSPATAASPAPSTPTSSARACGSATSSRGGRGARLLRRRPQGRLGASPSANRSVADSYAGFTDRPAFANAREIGEELTARYVDEELDRVELVYNRYVSPLTQHVWRQTLLPLQQAEVIGEGVAEAEEADAEETELEKAHEQARTGTTSPRPRSCSRELIPEYVTISVYRALLESAASELGARMTAMRNAAENAETMMDDLTLEMNRARQAEITQEILEVVAGAEALG